MPVMVWEVVVVLMLGNTKNTPQMQNWRNDAYDKNKFACNRERRNVDCNKNSFAMAHHTNTTNTKEEEQKQNKTTKKKKKKKKGSRRERLTRKKEGRKMEGKMNETPLHT